jgi:outer membrane protein
MKNEFVNMAATWVPVRRVMGLLVSATLLAAAPKAFAVDLLQVYRAALQNDPTLSAAEAAYRAGIEVVPQARSNLGPKVQASLSTSLDSANVNQQPTVRGNTTEGSLSLSQPLLNIGARRSLEQAKAQVPGIQAQLKTAQQELMLRVTRAYVDVLLAQDTLEQLQKQKEAVQVQLQRATRTFAIGTGTVIDREEAQARFDLITASELQGQGALAVAMRRLEGLLGQPIQGGLRGLNLSPLLVAQALEKESTTWEKLAEERNLSVLQAQSVATAQRRAVGVVRADFLPTAAISAGLTQRNSSQSGLTLDSKSDGRSMALGVQVAMPLWTSGSTSSRLRQAVALAEQADDNLVVARRSAKQEVRQAYINLTTGKSQVLAYEQAVESSQVSLNASLRGNEVGARTVVDVLNARQQAFQAQTDLARARYNLVINAFNLKAAVGGLSEADLKALSEGTLRSHRSDDDAQQRMAALPVRELTAVLIPEGEKAVPLRFDLSLKMTKPMP